MILLHLVAKQLVYYIMAAINDGQDSKQPAPHAHSNKQSDQSFYSAVVTFGLLEFIHANADAPPTGLLDDLGIVAMARGAFCSSEVTLFGSHLGDTFSDPSGLL